MIKIWNYNESPIGSFRGVKDVVIKLDETEIYSGEIKKAAGNLSNPSDCYEAITFTNKLLTPRNNTHSGS